MHLNNVLTGSGSALENYSMPVSISKMLEAMRAYESATRAPLVERIAQLEAERDAAIAMSCCECGSDEVCANLARLTAERDEARAEVQRCSGSVSV